MLRVLLLSIPVCGAMGSLIGFIFRGRKVAQLNIAILTSVAYFALLEWRLGDSTEWSWTDPIVSALYLFGPFVLFFLAPMLVASLLVGHRKPRP